MFAIPVIKGGTTLLAATGLLGAATLGTMYMASRRSGPSFSFGGGGGSGGTSRRRSRSSSRQRTERFVDESSSTHNEREQNNDDDEENQSEDEYEGSSTNVASHFFHRFVRYFRFGGMLQRISERSGISADDLVEPGASRYQDRSSSDGFHSAHVVRLGSVNRDLHRDHFRALSRFLGHTQTVPAWANYWRGIGGDFDRIQSDNLDQLLSIVFRGHPTDREVEVIERIRDLFLDALDEHINGGRLDGRQVRLLRKARRKIAEITAGDVFRRGRNGYDDYK